MKMVRSIFIGTLFFPFGGQSLPVPAGSAAGGDNPAALTWQGPPDTDPNVFEREVFDLINAERSKHGLPLFIWDDKIASVSRARSLHMARGDFFENPNPDGSTIAEMLEKEGIVHNGLVEIFYSGIGATKAVVNHWMDDPETKARILDEGYTNLGIGFHEGKWSLAFISTTGASGSAQAGSLMPDTLDIDSDAFEKEVLDLVNIERSNHGLGLLIWDDKLASVARAHSADMARRNFFDHTSPDGATPVERLNNAGIVYRFYGENCAMGPRTPKKAVDGWMNSPGHRANILNAKHTHLGVGFHKYYWTQVFIEASATAKPPAPTPDPGTDTGMPTITITVTQAQHERTIFDLINNERQKHGLGLLKWNDSLAYAAREMAGKLSRMDWTDIDEAAIMDGLENSAIGGNEGISKICVSRGIISPIALLDDAMNSPKSRAAVLNEGFTHLGVGFSNGFCVRLFIGP